MYITHCIKKTKTGIFLFLSLWLTACNSHRFLYYTPTPNNPTFEKKGESKISAAVSGNIFQYVHSLGGVFQGAYALTDHWAVGYSYDFRNEDTKFKKVNTDFFPPAINNYFDSSHVITSRNAHEFCVGYFTRIKRRRKIYFSTYAGCGIGNFYMKESGIATDTTPYQRHQNGTLNKLFIQPAFYFKPKPFFTLSLITKFSGFKYHFTQNNYTNDERNYYKMNVKSNDLFFVIEPTVMLSAGARNIHFMFSITLNAIIADKKLDRINNSLSAGFTADIAHLLKKK